MSNDFDIPDFMSEDNKNNQEPGSSLTHEFAPDSKIVFVFQEEKKPVLPSGEPPISEYPSVTDEEMTGIYVTTNAMMNLLIQKGIFTQTELAKKVKEVKKAYLDSKQ